ncbi:hypothetical protein Poli38472_004834 [Pythium oligandrum]|uniref:Uncharacterized protein n=1 Tax=Pythium oligandrum TaxID=41045 RepID=A0A8K1CBI3_PYTOL|nr:hypothetical protein Poli38472_004834 [Pythium oligandrum]|eukprot:TMW59765.1 hypothetical protein Poli38472_004834 [Pythium oligandrum]
MHKSGETTNAAVALAHDVRVEELAFDASLAFIDGYDSRLMDLMDGPGPPPANPHVEEMIDQAEELLKEMLTTTDVAEAFASPRVDSSSTSADESMKSSPVKKTKLTGAVRQKREMAYLRQQVEELEADLDRLKKRKTGESVAPAVREEGDAEAWKGMAERQRIAKQRAEVENTKLREALEDQLKIAQSLEKLLWKRMSAAPKEWGNVKPKNVFMPLENSDSVFQAISQSLASHPVPVDALWRECGLDQVHSNFKEVKSGCTEAEDLFLETTTCRGVPFPLQATANAVWHAVNATHWELHNESSGDAPTFGHEGRLHFTVDRTVRRSTVSVNMYSISQRKDEQDRVVFTWESRAFLTSAAFRDKNVRLKERGCMVIERDPAKPETSSLIKSCLRSWPEIEESTPSNRQFEFVVDLMLGSYHDNMQTMYELVENKLLDDARAQQ